MQNDNLALVLGGGGAAGHAWLVGLLAGLADEGRDLCARADLVIGTSAGATAAVHISGPATPAELFDAIMAEGSQTAPQRPRPGGSQHSGPSIEAVFERMRTIGAAATSAIDLQRHMGAFALESDPVLGPAAAERRRAMVAARLPDAQWPEGALMITAVDASTGESVTFSRASGSDLIDAVSASTAAPGLVPTVPINGARYIDGGVRSVENADLAEGFAQVVVLSPFGGPRQVQPGQFEGLRRESDWRTTLSSQVDYLRGQGSAVEVITPDEESRSAMGINAMDYSARIPSARAGREQGRREASRLTFV